MSEAVEAVEYELERLGPRSIASAREEAPWRREPPPSESLAALRPYLPRPPRDLAEALHGHAFVKVTRAPR